MSDKIPTDALCAIMDAQIRAADMRAKLLARQPTERKPTWWQRLARWLEQL